jgi:hypothetical protein
MNPGHLSGAPLGVPGILAASPLDKKGGPLRAPLVSLEDDPYCLFFTLSYHSGWWCFAHDSVT